MEMANVIFLSVVVSFVVTLLVMPFWIKKARRIGLIWDDMNKLNQKQVAGSGGLIVVMGFTLGVLIYVAIQTFVVRGGNNYVEVFTLTTAVLLLAIIGIIDDLLGWRHGGLSKRMRIALVLFAAIPLMVINAGSSQINFPFPINLGILYPLIFIPIGIIGATTTYNFLAGYNGLEAGQGILILSALSFVSFINGSEYLSIISACMVASLFGFLLFNRYPAKIFPGDSLTYPVGGLIAIIAILGGNFEIFAVFIFIPYILETGLKLRGKLKKHSFGEPQEDGSIKNKYDKHYGLEHIAITLIEKIKKSGKAYEWEVVLSIHAFQLAIIVIGLFAFIL